MKRAFIVGAPRSGTTWLQLLLAQHPGVATAQETHVFDRYVARLRNAWQSETDAELARKGLGISELISDEEFLEICRSLSERVFERIAARNPGAKLVVEKTPGHVLQARLVRLLYPDARFLHVVRDPRAVVASMRRAGRGWGEWWAPTGPLACAEVVRDHVMAGLEAAEEDVNWLLVKYEALLEDCPGTLLGCFAYLDLESSDTLCQDACRSCRIERLRQRTPPARMPWNLEEEPEGFFGRGGAEIWREELSSSDIRNIEYVTAEVMERLGYPSDYRYKRRPAASVIRGLVGRFKNALDRILSRVLQRM